MPILALSNAESELAAITKGMSEGMGTVAVLHDFGRSMELSIKSDATAAIGICKRMGLGRIRHLAVADLWCQQILRQKKATVSKWPGPENPSDLFTKFLPRNEILAHMRRMNMFEREGRAPLAPIRQGTSPCSIPAQFDPEDDHELMVYEVHCNGLGGCLDPTQTPYRSEALAWADMCT